MQGLTNWLTRVLVRPYIYRELPAWGVVYRLLVGEFNKNASWATAGPLIISDKRYGLYRLLDLREWADRSFYFLGRWYDLRAQLLVDLIVEPGFCIVDVGANYGHFSLAAAARTGVEGFVYAFEPNPSSCSRLRVHRELNRLTQLQIFEFGISDAPGSLTLNIPVINSGEATFAGRPYENFREVICQICTLDSQSFGKPVDLVKIDVEGFELRVLNGARRMIEINQPLIVTEVVRKHLARANALPEELVNVLSSFGYTAYCMSTRRNGRSQSLVLTKASPKDLDGDYFWVPESRKNILDKLKACGVLKDVGN